MGELATWEPRRKGEVGSVAGLELSAWGQGWACVCVCVCVCVCTEDRRRGKEGEGLDGRWGRDLCHIGAAWRRDSPPCLSPPESSRATDSMSKSHPSEVAVRPRWSFPSSGGGGGLCQWPGFSGITAQHAGAPELHRGPQAPGFASCDWSLHQWVRGRECLRPSTWPDTVHFPRGTRRSLFSGVQPFRQEPCEATGCGRRQTRVVSTPPSNTVTLCLDLQVCRHLEAPIWEGE